LLITVTGSEEDGNPAEISGRVRAAAYVALTQCLAGQTIHNSPSEPPGAGRPEYPGAEEVPPSQEPAGKLTTYYQTVGTEPQQQILGEAKRVVEQYQRVQVAGEQRQSGGSLAELWARSGDMESGQQPASIARRGGTPLPPASASEIRQPVFPLPSQGAVLQQRPAAAGTAYSSGASDPLPDQGFLFPLSGERDKRASMTSRLPDPGQYVR